MSYSDFVLRAGILVDYRFAGRTAYSDARLLAARAAFGPQTKLNRRTGPGPTAVAASMRLGFCLYLIRIVAEGWESRRVESFPRKNGASGVLGLRFTCGL